MRKITSYAAIAMLSTSSFATNPTYAADVLGDHFDDCTCVTSANDTGSLLGEITLANGEVVSSGVSGVENASVGTPILNGSEITTGTGGASVSIGASCNLALRPNSVMSVFQPTSGGPICVKVVDTVGPAIASSTPVVSSNPLLVLGIIGGIGGAALLLGGGDDPASN